MREVMKALRVPVPDYVRTDTLLVTHEARARVEHWDSRPPRPLREKRRPLREKRRLCRWESSVGSAAARAASVLLVLLLLAARSVSAWQVHTELSWARGVTIAAARPVDQWSLVICFADT